MTGAKKHSKQLPKGASAVLVVICIVLYGLSYFARVSYNVTLTELSGVIPFDTVGLIGTVYFLCYAVGQLLNGLVITKVSPFVYLPAGMFVSAACNLFMAFAQSPVLMTAVWGINGFAQSMLWAPILIIFTETIAPALKDKALLWLSVAAPVGTLLCYLLGGVLIDFGYAYVFICAAALLLAGITVFFLFCFSARKKFVITQTEADGAAALDLSADKKKATIFTCMGIVSLGMLFLSVTVQGMLKDGMTAWVPTMLKDKFTLSSSLSVFLTMLLPVINVFGAFAATLLYRKTRGKKEFAICAVFMTLAVMLTAVMMIPNINEYGFAVLLSVITTAMFGFNQVSIVLIPLRFEAVNKVAAVSGALNAFTYLGSAIASYAIDLIRDRFSWTAVILFVFAVAVSGAVAAVIGQLTDAAGRKRRL